VISAFSTLGWLTDEFLLNQRLIQTYFGIEYIAMLFVAGILFLIFFTIFLIICYVVGDGIVNLINPK
jgi:hypothetical protein